MVPSSVCLWLLPTIFERTGSTLVAYNAVMFRASIFVPCHFCSKQYQTSSSPSSTQYFPMKYHSNQNNVDQQFY